MRMLYPMPTARRTMSLLSHVARLTVEGGYHLHSELVPEKLVFSATIFILDVTADNYMWCQQRMLGTDVKTVMNRSVTTLSENHDDVCALFHTAKAPPNLEPLF